MEIEKFLGEKAKEINRELELFLPKKTGRQWVDFVASKPEYAYDLKTVEESIAKPVWDFLERGGKRWRPALMLLACEVVGGDASKAKEFTVLPELIHTGTIVCDDVEDHSLLRRGKPTLHRIYGEDVAINTGNMLYFLPLRIIEKRLKGKGFEEKALKIYNLYAEEMIRLSLGQAMDIYWHRGNADAVTEEQYLQMCVYKTGALARFSMKLGAILGDASEKQVSVLGDFAASIGVAFQIQDDILNIVPPEKWGKEIGDDINEGKRTLLVIHALKNTSGENAKRLVAILDSHTGKKTEILEAIGIIRETGAIEYAKEKAKAIVEASWRALDREIESSDAKQLLKGFADFVVEREI